MPGLDTETRRVIEFFVRDNISRVVEQIFNDPGTITTLRSWLEAEATSKIAKDRRRRIVELADDLNLGEETKLGDIREQVVSDSVSE